MTLYELSYAHILYTACKIFEIRLVIVSFMYIYIYKGVIKETITSLNTHTLNTALYLYYKGLYFGPRHCAAAYPPC